MTITDLHVATNRIDLFQRSPSELRRYRRYIYQLEIAHGSIMKFIINHRLKWQSVVAQGPPFSCPEDVKVLYNDWPYGIDKRIIHLVVWVKFELEDDPVTGFLTEEANGQIQNYVDKTFCRRIVPEHVRYSVSELQTSLLTGDQVAWFKNWRSLKSIQAVEHFHVMLFDPDMDFVRSITNGDVPQSTITYK